MASHVLAKASGKQPQPYDRRGKPSAGRIAKILTGQGHGFIRLRDGRDVYFHRADSPEGTAFNDLKIGNAVTFELVEDGVSGARALRVTRQNKRS